MDKTYKEYKAIVQYVDGVESMSFREHERKFAPYWYKKLCMRGLFYWEKPNMAAHFRSMGMRLERMKKGNNHINCKIDFLPGFFASADNLYAALFARRASMKGIYIHTNTFRALDSGFGSNKKYVFANGKCLDATGNFAAIDMKLIADQYYFMEN